METKVGLILESLTGTARVEFSRLLRGLEGIQAKMHGVMTLLASLELTRRRAIYMRQVSPFSDLWIYRRAEDEQAYPTEDDLEPESEADAASEPKTDARSEPEPEVEAEADLDSPEPPAPNAPQETS